MALPYRGFVTIVDDDPEMRAMLVDHLEMEGFSVKSFSDGQEGVSFLKSHTIDAESTEVVITDLRMPEVDGLSLLRAVKAHKPTLPVIIMTAHASMESAIEGLRKGAFDYITKPFKLAELTHSVEKAAMFYRLQSQNKALSSEVKKSWTLKTMIGKSAPMKEVFALVERVAASSTSVLISGESGTGKEVVARALHETGPRAEKPFVAINCTAIPETLLESELFGYVKGAFTGANTDKIGLFEEANGGTLFLDEIGDMALSLQTKLLRVLQERLIRPVGSSKTKPIDVRIIAATHKDLKKAIQNNLFREDLYFRLAVIPIYIPPLRERSEDIPLLAQHFLNKYSLMNGGKVIGFQKEALQQLMTEPWRGNVRELENMVERLVVLAKSNLIELSDIPKVDQMEQNESSVLQGSPSLEELEKKYIAIVLQKTGNHKEKAAQILGINRRTLYRKEREYGLSTANAEEVEEHED